MQQSQERAKPIPNMDENSAACRRTTGYAIYHSPNYNPHSRFANLMYFACKAVQNSPTVIHHEMPGETLFDKPKTVHRFDWSQELKTNAELNSCLYFAKKMLSQANSVAQIINPDKKLSLQLKTGPEEISLLELTGRFQDNYPLLSEQFALRLNTEKKYLEDNDLQYILSKKALLDMEGQGMTYMNKLGAHRKPSKGYRHS